MKDLRKNTETRAVDSYYELRSCACGPCRCDCTCEGLVDLTVQRPRSSSSSSVESGYRTTYTSMIGG